MATRRGVLAAAGWAGALLLAAGAAQGAEELWSKLVPRAAEAPEYFVAPDGTPTNAGTRESPWDLASAAGGKQKVAPGGVVWVRGGRYIYPIRNTKEGGNGFAVALSGVEGKPVFLRGYPGERAIIDGGFQLDASWLWVWDLEFNLGDDWRPKEPSPQGQNTPFKTPTGVLNLTGGNGVKIVNCLSHNNHMGVGFWKFVKNGEIHGCVIYDNGFPGTDRPHGPALYTQNETGTPRLVTDNIIGGNFSLAIQAYGSKIDQMVNDFTIEGNVEFAPRKEARGRCYNQLGGSQSKNMVFRDNFIYGFDVRLTTKTNAVGEGNTVVRAGYSGPTPEKNTLIADPVAAKPAPFSILRPNKYDPGRAHVVVSNWLLAEKVEVDLKEFLKAGEKFRLLSPFDLHGKALAEGTWDGKPLSVAPPPVPWQVMTGDPREIAVFVVMKSSGAK
jgi:hypothetical protein